MISLAGSVLASGCRKERTPESPVEIYAPHDGAVSFDVTSVSFAPDGSSTWEASYLASGKTARFKFVLASSQPLKDDKSLGFGRGRFIAVSGSDPEGLLEALKTNLEAKYKPIDVRRVSELPFVYADLGDYQSRNDDGSFQASPPGHWHVLKLFLADENAADDAEVFFNLNPSLKKGEFSIKDSDYGDDVLARLAKVL